MDSNNPTTFSEIKELPFDISERIKKEVRDNINSSNGKSIYPSSTDPKSEILPTPEEKKDPDKYLDRRLKEIDEKYELIKDRKPTYFGLGSDFRDSLGYIVTDPGGELMESYKKMNKEKKKAKQIYNNLLNKQKADKKKSMYTPLMIDRLFFTGAKKKSKRKKSKKMNKPKKDKSKKDKKHYKRKGKPSRKKTIKRR